MEAPPASVFNASTLWCSCRPNQRTPRLLTSKRTILHDSYAVHDYMANPDRKLVRICEGRPVLHSLGVEHGDISKHPLLNEAAFALADLRG